MQLCFPCKGLVKVTSMLLSWKIYSIYDSFNKRFSTNRSNVDRTTISSNWELQFSRHACCSRFTWNLITDVARMRIDPHFFPPIVVQSLDKEKQKGKSLNIFPRKKKGTRNVQSYRAEANASSRKYAGERREMRGWGNLLFEGIPNNPLTFSRHLKSFENLSVTLYTRANWQTIARPIYLVRESVSFNNLDTKPSFSRSANNHRVAKVYRFNDD